jgi:hypothetical protein
LLLQPDASSTRAIASPRIVTPIIVSFPARMATAPARESGPRTDGCVQALALDYLG